MLRRSLLTWCLQCDGKLIFDLWARPLPDRGTLVGPFGISFLGTPCAGPAFYISVSRRQATDLVPEPKSLESRVFPRRDRSCELTFRTSWPRSAGMPLSLAG